MFLSLWLDVDSWPVHPAVMAESWVGLMVKTGNGDESAVSWGSQEKESSDSTRLHSMSLMLWTSGNRKQRAGTRAAGCRTHEKQMDLGSWGCAGRDPHGFCTYRKLRAADHRVQIKDGGDSGFPLPPAELRSHSWGGGVPMCDGV